MEKTKRLDYLDMAKGFGIILVVLGHMEDIATGTRVWISSFHMPLFFMISGILMAVKNEQERDLLQCLKKRYRGIIIPYLWFSLSYFIIDIGNLYVVRNIDLHTFIVDTISSATFYGMSVLWFLPALFLASVGFLFLKKKIPDAVIAPLIIVSALVSYVIRIRLEFVYEANSDSLFITSIINIAYTLLRAVVALSFVGYGFYAKKLADRLMLTGSKAVKFMCSKPGSLIFGVVLLCINIRLAMLNDCVDLRNILLNNIWIYYIGAFTGCFGVILICRALPGIRLIEYFGRNSLIVMACHINYYFLYAGLRLAWIVDSFNNHAKHYVFVAVTVITVFALSVVVIEVINRFFPFVLGKGRIRLPGDRNA
ncbi:MAG: acyltransferase family protein [Lachnospiraceae bacterium]|nr:acyltransferase family protein [Lachnospiraceae bacterium]